MKNHLEHNYALDLIRIIAGLEVIIIHVSDPLVNFPVLFGGITWWFANIINSVSRTGVPLFIILSGSLLLDRKKQYDIHEFYKSKVLKLFLVLIVWYLIYFLWGFFFLNMREGISNAVVSFFFPTGGHLYFIFIILGLYIITPWLKTFSQKNLIKVSVLGLSLGILFNFVYYILKLPIYLLNAFSFFLPFVGYYAFGGITSSIKINKKYIPILISSVFLLAIFTAAFSYLNFVSISKNLDILLASGGGQYFYDRLSLNVAALSLAIFLVLLKTRGILDSKLNQFGKKTLKSISSNIFGVYLIHVIVIDVADKYLRLGVANLVSPIILFLCIKILLVFLISVLLVILIKKIPILKYIIP